MSRQNRPVNLPMGNTYAHLALAAFLAPGQKLVTVLPSEDQARRVFERVRHEVEQLGLFAPLPVREPLTMAKLEDAYRYLGGPS